MNRKHAAVIAALLGAAVAAGAFAATRTSAAETGGSGAREQAIVERSRSLDEIERSLEQTLAASPPSQTARSGAPAYRGDDRDERASRDDRADDSYGSASEGYRAGPDRESDDDERGYGDDGYESERGDDD